jgi:hypothetical protein
MPRQPKKTNSVPAPAPEPAPEVVASVDVEPKRKRSKTASAAAAAVAPETSWKQDFAKFLEIQKPEDPFDCQVKIGKDDRCDPSKIKDGMLLDRPARLIVLDSSSGRVRNQELFDRKIDSDWSLGQDLIRKQCWTADLYSNVEERNKTQLAHMIRNEVGDSLCKVEFTKSPDSKALAQLMMDGSKMIETSGATEDEKLKAYKSLVERVQKGEYRIMRGYIKRSDGDMDIQLTDTGMVKFVDADLHAKGEMADRMLNLNNVTALTLRGTKYVLK